MNSPVTINIDRISFQLQEEQDFQWLQKLGKAFCVYDQQDSGNICFGVENNGKKRFVKYAGAKTLEYKGNPQGAIDYLKQATHLYKHLSHEHLVQLIDHFEVATGYVAVFEWFDGDCLHPHWSFPPPAKYVHPDSPFYRFRQLPIGDRLDSLESIFSFHEFVECKNYVAIDFYDGSILYDFKQNITKICDIDLYQKKPYINNMGRLWGSSRFMSPEEFQLGAEIDARTNVFNMGAIAFGLIGGERDRSFSKWDAGKKLYEVAARAVAENKEHRYPTVAEFHNAWKTERKTKKEI